MNVGVAISGGADSTALLRIVVEIQRDFEGQGTTAAFHVNHHLRGAESDREQQWCEELCDKLGVAFYPLQANVVETARIEGDGCEAAARKQRYALLTAAAMDHGVRYLLTAHTRDDQVETVLFRMIRGTGIRGLGGMAFSRLLSPSVTLIRPMLQCTREEVLVYLSQLGQDYCIDSSNLDFGFKRNRIRLELLPLLRASYNSSIEEVLIRLAKQAAEFQTEIEARAAALLAGAEFRHRTSSAVQHLQLNVTGLGLHSDVLVREVLRLAWRQARFPEQGMTYKSWLMLGKLAKRDAGTTSMHLPGNFRARIEGDLLLVERHECQQP